jgi:hypothetical protein
MEYWSIGGLDRGPQTALNMFTILGNGPWDLIGHIGHKTHVLDFYDSTSLPIN